MINLNELRTKANKPTFNMTYEKDVRFFYEAALHIIAFEQEGTLIGPHDHGPVFEITYSGDYNNMDVLTNFEWTLNGIRLDLKTLKDHINWNMCQG